VAVENAIYFEWHSQVNGNPNIIVQYDVYLHVDFNSTQDPKFKISGHLKLKPTCFTRTPFANSMTLQLRNNVNVIFNAIMNFLVGLHLE
jgi:hypothetical protein